MAETIQIIAIWALKIWIAGIIPAFFTYFCIRRYNLFGIGYEFRDLTEVLWFSALWPGVVLAVIFVYINKLVKIQQRFHQMQLWWDRITTRKVTK